MTMVNMQAELKVNVGRRYVPAAIRALDLPRHPKVWQVMFAEDAVRGLWNETPLLEQHVVIRARVKPGGRGDCTVKLRPCRMSQLTDRWREAANDKRSQFKIEQDWSETRRALAASLTVKVAASRILDVHRRHRPISQLLSGQQQRLVRQCSPAAVNLHHVHLLGPTVRAVRWASFTVPGPTRLTVRAERWTVDDLDFLELSAIASVGSDAERAQAALRDSLARLSIPLADVESTKTTAVLRTLVGGNGPPLG